MTAAPYLGLGALQPAFDLAGASRTAMLLLGFAFLVLACTAWLRARERA